LRADSFLLDEAFFLRIAALLLEKIMKYGKKIAFQKCVDYLRPPTYLKKDRHIIIKKN